MADFPDYFLDTSPPEVKSNTPVHYSDGMSLKSFTRRVPAHRWEFEANGIVKRDYIPSFNSFLMQLEGRLSTFTYPTPPEFAIDESIPNSQTTLNQSSAGDNTVVIVGVPEILGKSGFFVRFGGSTKIYMVTSVTGDNSIMTITIFPRLKSDLGLADAVIFNPDITVRLDSDVTGGSTNTKLTFKRYSLRMIEAL